MMMNKREQESTSCVVRRLSSLSLSTQSSTEQLVLVLPHSLLLIFSLLGKQSTYDGHLPNCEIGGVDSCSICTVQQQHPTNLQRQRQRTVTVCDANEA